MTTTVKPNQTVFDIALKYYGTSEAVGEILSNNPSLKNAPDALQRLGVNYIADSDFYMDVALLPGQTIAINTDSDRIRQEIIRELKQNEITTYGKND